MKRFVLFFLVLFLIAGLRSSYAVLDRFNVGVGYSASNELSISTDTPGEFDYTLYLRTADNTPTNVSVHYTGVDTFSRKLKLSCDSGETSANDNANTGACINGGPFVRGVFVAGNTNQFAAAKRFTLFCGSVQILASPTTDHWDSGFTSTEITDFLNNGASSTWCPTPASTTSTPTLTPSPKATRTPTPRSRATPTPTEEIYDETDATTEEIPTPSTTISFGTGADVYRSTASNPIAQIVGFMMIVLGAILTIYFNRNLFIHLWKKLRGETVDVPNFEPEENLHDDLK